MKVLFISACQDEGVPKSVVSHQGESLIRRGLDVTYFCIKGGGLRGYLRSIPSLRRELKSLKPDIVHAHYSLSGFLASICGASPIVVSLMGSDTHFSLILRLLTKMFARYAWGRTIVKSPEMARSMGLGNLLIIPNGVDLELFSPCEKEDKANVFRVDSSLRVVLFAANPGRPEKNYALAESAMMILNDSNTVLIPIYDKPATEMASFYNAADLLLLTSLWEGSPNVVKEAMACNLPVVSTDVGDVAWLLKGVEGCRITTHDPYELATAIRATLNFSKKINGREKLLSLGLDANSTAARIENIYLELLKSQDGNSKGS